MKKFAKLTSLMLAVFLLVSSLSACSFLFKKDIPVERITLSQAEVTLKEGETLTIFASVTPSDATDATVSYTSSNTAVATVSSNGVITAMKAGTCTITASAGGKVAFVNVTVKLKGPDFQTLYNSLSSTYGWTLGSDGSYLAADTNVYDLDDYSNFDIWEEIKEMNKKMGLPESLTNDMANTTWSMGKQVARFESIGVEVTWTYHPDKGMEVTYKLINQ